MNSRPFSFCFPHTPNQSHPVGIGTTERNPRASQLLWARCSPGQEQVGNANPTQEEVGGKRCPDTYFFSSAFLQEPGEICEVMSFILKWKKKFAPTKFRLSLSLTTVSYSDPYHTAVHTRMYVVLLLA